MLLTRLGLLGLALAATLGCDAGLGTVPVTGKVTMGSSPVENATVVFYNRDMKGKPAKGMTDKQGNFTLTTYFNAKQIPQGALPGEYDVVITKLDTDSAMTTATGFPRQLLPAKYAERNSGLEAIVKKGGDTKFDFKLDTF